MYSPPGLNAEQIVCRGVLESMCEHAHTLRESMTTNSPIAGGTISWSQTTPSDKQGFHKPHPHDCSSCSYLSVHPLLPSYLESMPTLLEGDSNTMWDTKPVFQRVRPGSRDMSKLFLKNKDGQKGEARYLQKARDKGHRRGMTEVFVTVFITGSITW